MDWLTSLRDQLPLLLVLSPLIGFVVTLTASRFEPGLVRTLAISNALCSLFILTGLERQFEFDLAADADIIRLAERDIAKSDTDTGSISEVRRTLDRRRVERLRHQWFAVDGTNLFPALLLVVMTIIVIQRMDSSSDSNRWFIPLVMLFETASLGVMTTYDLRVYLILSATSTVIISLLISQYGNSERRANAEQFLLTQYCGGAFVAMGFAMLVVAVPWMKIQDSTNTQSISWNIANITQEIQKWATRNELAYHYVYECFPWMLLVLSVGFAIQAGLFPFHSTQISVMSNAQPEIAILLLAGTLSASRIGWLRFVMPLAPDLMVSFDGWMLIPSLGGAIWGALRAIAPAESRQRPTYIYLSISGLLLLGCYCFTRIGMSGAWLMQQQLTVIMCSILLVIDDRQTPSDDIGQRREADDGMRFSTRTLLMLACFPILGFFASSFLIVSELINENLLLAAIVFVISAMIFIALKLAIDQHDRLEKRVSSDINRKWRFPLWYLVMLSLTIASTVFPGWLLHQCEPEFTRVFRRFEQTSSADFAEPAKKDRQSAP
ncbi:MAG: hypothetical protein WCH39_03950 [Schlesneria sp.]